MMPCKIVSNLWRFVLDLAFGAPDPYDGPTYPTTRTYIGDPNA